MMSSVRRRQVHADEPDIHLKTSDEIAVMREAGHIVACAHEEMKKAVRPGISTWDLDQIAEAVIRDHGAVPAFLGYPKDDSIDFPASITACINEELIHGIPSKEHILQEGDIISVDTACHYKGFVGDAAYTWPVGEISPSIRRLLEITEKALYVAIEASVLPHDVKYVARETQRFVERQGYSVARGYAGHGVGKKMHEDPEVPNWWPRKRDKRLDALNAKLQPGMTYAIEPMVISGRGELKELDNGWTVVTKDRSLCAHFEHTIAITKGEPEILTLL